MGQISFEVPGPGTYSITADPTLAPLDNPGAAADVLTGKQFYRSDNTPVTGTMPNNPPEAVTIEAGGSYTIPQGYHSGMGTVTSEGTALPTLDNPGTAADLLAGKELIDGEGEKVTGTMANNGAVNETLNAGDSYTIPAGYHNGSGSVAAASLSSQTPGTADSGDIVSGQTAWVNGEQITGTLEPGSQTGDATATANDILDGETAYVATGKVTGTMPNNNAVTETLDAGAAYTIPAGYHNGQGTVTANSLASQTQGTATAEDIMQGETAWVNGQQITGTATPGTDTSDATATADQILSPYTAYVASGKVTGTIPTNTDDAVTINGEQVSVGAGYYANAVSKAIPTVAQAVPSITVSETGLITATATQNAGFVAQGTESATRQLTTQGAQTITPTTTAQTIAAGTYLTGAQTIQGDANLVSANIKDGVSIFGVSGSYQGNMFAVPLIVTVASGANVTAQNGDIILTAVSNGTATITLTAPGEWEVSAELADGRSTNVANITVPESYTATLAPIPSAQYYGTVTPLTVGKTNLVGTSVGGYAIFSGGNTDIYHRNEGTTTNAYDSSLTQTTPAELFCTATNFGSATHNDNYGIFAQDKSITSYSSSLTRSQPDALNGGSHQGSAAPIGEYALFVASQANNYGGAATAYDSTLTKTTPDADTTYRIRNNGGHNRNYALIVGGNFASTAYADVVCYDASLTKSIGDSLSQPMAYATSAAIGDYAIFVSTQVVNAYSNELTRTVMDSLPTNFPIDGAASTVGDYAVFCCNSVSYAFNSALTRSTPPALQTPRAKLAAATTVGYALFAGGQPVGSSAGNPDYYSTVVEAYTGTPES